MKLAYQTATPEVRPGPGVTAYQGDIERAFALLTETGYDGAELMVSNPREVDREQIKKLAEKYHLDIPMICTGEIFGQDGLFFSSPSAEIREEAVRRACEAVDLAEFFGAQVNVGRLRGGLVFGENEEDCRRRSAEGLKILAEYAQKKQVTAALEPVNTLALNYINRTEEGIRMVQEIGNPYMCLMLDTAHMYIEDKDIPGSIRRAAPYTSYIHLSDSNRLYPGNSKFDFEGFIKSVKETGYDGWLSVEVFQRPDGETAVQKSYEYIKPLLL